MRPEYPSRVPARRLVLAAAVLLAAVAGLTTLGRSDPAMEARPGEKPLTARDSAVIVLNRLAYGPRPGDIDRVASVGVLRWVDRQLSPGKDPSRERLESGFEILKLDREELARAFVEARQARREQRSQAADPSGPRRVPR